MGNMRSSGDLTRGGGPYACPRIGLASGLPALARCGPPRGFPCQIRRGLVTLRIGGPKRPFCFAPPTGARHRRCGTASGSSGERAELAARAARRAALKPVQKVVPDSASVLCQTTKVPPADHRAGSGPRRLRARPSTRKGTPRSFPIAPRKASWGPTLARGASANPMPGSKGRQDLPQSGARPPPSNRTGASF